MQKQRFDGKVRVLYEFARKPGKIADCFNFEKALSDFLVLHGVLADDSLIEEGTVTASDVKEMIAGFVLMECASLDEAIAWAKRCPALTEGAEIEVRQVLEAADFPEDLLDELQRHASKKIAADAREMVREREVARV